MKRRVHPKVQMLHGARLAVQHSKELTGAAIEDYMEVFKLIREEILALSGHGRRAYLNMRRSESNRAFRQIWARNG